ncbi:MAG TPA: D-alanyl-D-alanine carboxypeptidase/D-alanyl-D-alanine-endopeptidase [Pyrinomonadaceae bacterium]|nr:D-alanyl-D-alanine carboxypeptidase/D-alanyl-D-alanine-endopeptidase [Pyrinomonadaceae bacterium]
MKLLNQMVLSAAIFGTSFIALSGNNAVSADSLPTPSPTPATRPRTTPTPLATRPTTPTASPTAIPAPAAKPMQTIEELQSTIRQRLFDPAVRRGRVGVKVVSLSSGKVVFEQDSEKYFMPASNMKNFTVAAAMEKLGPDFKFVTSVYANSLPDSSGTIKGDLRIYGRGDISISTAFFGTSPSDPDTYYKGIDRLVDRIAAAGIKKIEGSIVGDESYFKGFYIPGGWEWDDLQAYYGAEVSALPINDNAVDINVSPGTTGSPCNVTISPANKIFQVVNTCTTGGPSSTRTLSVVKKLDRNIVEVSGSMPAGKPAYVNSIAVTRPAELFVALLKRRLEATGIVVTGDSRLLPPNAKPTQNIEVAKLESPPFAQIAAKTMKPSQNMFTETILWTLGVEGFRKDRGQIPTVSDGTNAFPVTEDSSVLGLNQVKAFLKKIDGMAEDGIIQSDGSGLSRHDLITPAAVVTLYRYMAFTQNAQAWRESLTIAGVDGTLANRLKGTAAEANFRGKTGTIDQVSALSGYMTTAAGEQLVVSIIVNNVGGPTRTRTSLADDIVTALANFNGKVD